MVNKKLTKQDIVSRFIYRSRDILSNGKIKKGAFIDNRYPTELSVCCITQLLNYENKIWELSSKIRDKIPKARGDLKVFDIENIELDENLKLEVWRNGYPISEHSNIRLNSLGILQEQMIAQKLAKIAGKAIIKNY